MESGKWRATVAERESENEKEGKEEEKKKTVPDLPMVSSFSVIKRGVEWANFQKAVVRNSEMCDVGRKMPGAGRVEVTYTLLYIVLRPTGFLLHRRFRF